MYLKSKIAGVQINKIYIPSYLTGFTIRIINFVLETPFVDTGKIEFVIEKGGKQMNDFKLENEKQETETLETVEKEHTDTSEDSVLMTANSYKTALKEFALLSTMLKVKALEARIEELEKKQCSCCTNCNNKDAEAA